MQMLSQIGNLLWEAAVEWKKDRAALMSAALAFYTLFSMAPLLIIAIALAGLIFGQMDAQQEILVQVGGLIGEKAATALTSMIHKIQEPDKSLPATAMAFAAFLLGASVAFYHLQEALNTIWGVQRRYHNGVWNYALSRLTALSIVLITGFFMLVSLLVNAVLELMSEHYQTLLQDVEFVWKSFNTVLSIVIATFLFALMFKYIPQAKVRWGDVWLGAAITALLFSVGKYAIGFYLGHSSLASLYGAAGSLVIILIWMYYSAQILFYGAEVTRVYARNSKR